MPNITDDDLVSSKYVADEAGTTYNNLLYHPCMNMTKNYNSKTVHVN